MTSQNKTYNILFAGGGTGGHVTPIANVIRTLDTQQNHPPCHLFRYGNTKSMEQQTATSLSKTIQTPLTFRSITSGKIRRDKSVSSLFRNIRDVLKVGRGTLQAIRYCKRDAIDVIWCKGGHVAGPVIVASRLLRIPLIVHESDTRMGLINRVASRHARTVCTAFEGVHPRGRIIGQLLSDVFAQSASRADFASLIGKKAPSDHPHVLVMGGSQGSQSLYESLATAMRMKPQIYRKYTFVVIGGLLSSNLQKLFADYPNVVVLDFLEQDQLRLCYQYCDIALTRAGTTSLAEQKLRNMLLVMVPIPRTHDQKHNAKRYVQQHGDIMIEQNDTLTHQLDMVFATLTTHHKHIQQTDDQRLATIQKPKNTLLEMIFTYAKT